MRRAVRTAFRVSMALLLLIVAAGAVLSVRYLLNTTEVTADEATGFSWGYVLHAPAGAGRDGRPVFILVLPNNTGRTDDDASVHRRSAAAMSFIGHLAFSGMDVAVLVPEFPRPSRHDRIYTHALDRDCLTTEVDGLRRLDLQLVAMIDDASRRLRDEGRQVETKVLMAGFSASGMFVNRFVMLHPERVKAAAIGSPGGWPIAPAGRWNDEPLSYPVGISDVAVLAGRPVNLSEVGKVPMFLFLGDRDDNDSVPYSDSYDDRERDLVNRLFGETPVSRWEAARRFHEAAGLDAEFHLYPGVGHAITLGEILDIRDFLRRATGQE